MKAVTFAKPRGRLIFTPETGALTLDHDGAGLTHFLTKPEMVELSKALWYSALTPPERD